MDASDATWPNPQALSDNMLERNELINEFWDKYTESGVEVAGNFFKETIHSDVETTKLLIPFLVEEGYRRDIDMQDFFKNAGTVQLEEETDAVRTTDDGRGVPVSSDNEADNTEDEAQPAQERDADSESDTE